MVRKGYYVKKLFLMITVISLLLCGCTPAETNQDPSNQPGEGIIKASDYFPAVPGSHWSYLGEGNEYASFTRKTLYEKGNLVQFTTDNGGTVTTTIFEIGKDYIKSVYFEGESYEPGNFLEQGFTPNDDTIVIKEPLAVGTTWKNENDSREIVSIDTTINTPAGNFDNCLKIKITTENSTMYDYYQEGTGLIKSEFLSEGNTITSTLEEFQIN